MKPRRIYIVTTLFMLCLNCFGHETDFLIPKLFMNCLKAQNFIKVHSLCDESAKSKLSSGALETTWAQVIPKTGKLIQVADYYREEENDHIAFYFPCQFEKQLLDIKVMITSNNGVGDFSFVPHEDHIDPNTYQLPDYNKSENYYERGIEIKSVDGHVLKGILTVPKSTKQVPVIILVHGSGPNDRDESVGPNKVFKDLAIGLANFGIATIRYDKRTYTYADEYQKGITIRKEVIEDALTAIKLCKIIPQINLNEIYLAGHNLGGMLAPEIAMEAKELKGIILLAANSSPLEDLIYNQYKHLFNLGGTMNKFESDQLKSIKAQVDYTKSNKLSLNSPTDSLLLGLPASYWIGLKSYHPVKTFGSLKKKCLVLQGEQDYRVPISDYQVWKNSQSINRDITAISYPKLNHLFIEADASAEEYAKAQHVAYYVIEDIAKWVNGSSPFITTKK